MSPDEMEKGRAWLEQCVKVEPGYAPAWVHIADYYIAGTFFSQGPPRDLWLKAKECAQRAVAADPELADAHTAVGYESGPAAAKESGVITG
jgi:hypothetical protein